MKLVSYLLILFLIEMYNAIRKSASSNVIRIPLRKTHPSMNLLSSAYARTRIVLDDSTINLHTGQISIGTPPQTFNVVFDTGSTDLFLLSRYYDTCATNSEEALNGSSYDRLASSTYQQPRKVPKPQVIEYATAWVFGYKAVDVIKISNDEIRTEFLEVTRTNDAQVGAVMGLGYHPTKGSIVSRLCQITEGQQKFSFYLPKEKGADYGELLLCGTNETKYDAETLQYVDESNPGDWFFKINKVLMNQPGRELQLISEKVVGVADTGSNRISVPSDSYRFLESASKAYLIRRNATSLTKRLNCGNLRYLPVLNIIMKGGLTLSLTADDYVTRVPYDGSILCYFPFHENSEEGQWVFGESFFRKYYTIYDMENHRVGFAVSRG